MARTKEEVQSAYDQNEQDYDELELDQDEEPQEDFEIRDAVPHNVTVIRTVRDHPSWLLVRLAHNHQVRRVAPYAALVCLLHATMPLNLDATPSYRNGTCPALPHGSGSGCLKPDGRCTTARLN